MNARRLRLPEVHMPKLSRGTTTPNDDGSLEDSFSSVENNQTRLTKTGEELRDLLRQVDYSHRELAQKHLRPFLEPSRWERIRRGHPMLRSGNQKTKLFYQLNSRIEQEDRDVSAEDLNQIVSDWSNQESEDPTTHNQVTNLTLLSQVRLRFLGNISDPEQGMTRSQKAITDMQAALGRRS